MHTNQRACLLSYVGKNYSLNSFQLKFTALVIKRAVRGRIKSAHLLKLPLDDNLDKIF